jgi:hypothetical protein
MLEVKWKGEGDGDKWVERAKIPLCRAVFDGGGVF